MEKFSKNEVRKATITSLNKTSVTLRARISKRVSKRLKMPSKAIKSRFVLGKAKKNRLNVLMRVFTQPKPIHSLMTPGQLEKAIVKPAKRGIKYKGQSFQKGFAFRSSKAGKPLVFQRMGASRYPIEPITVPIEQTLLSVADIFVKKTSRFIFKKNFDSQLKRFIARRKK